MFLKKHRLGNLVICLMLTMFWGFGSLIMPGTADAKATTSLTITKLASDGKTVLGQQTVDYHWLENPDNIPVMGDGVKRYYHQGPVFIDDPNPDKQALLRWNVEEDTNWDTKNMGAVKGTNAKDLCELVGGMKEGDKLEFKAIDGWHKAFAYKNVYDYTDREGPIVVCWYKDGQYPDTGYTDGMRMVWFAGATEKKGPTSIMGLPSGEYHVFGNWDWHEAANPEYWYYFSGVYPTTTGLSGQTISDLIIYSNEPVPEIPVADFTADITSGIAPLTVSFADNSIGTAPLTYAWDFDNDGTVDSTEQNPTHEYSAAGTYSVKLTATNAAGSNDKVKTDYITVAAAGPKIWYVNKSGGADFTTIQAAVTAASIGDTIIVKDGTYTENVVVDKSLVIKSENGADLTAVQAANTKADVFLVKAANVTIDGFTVSGATNMGKSGIAIWGTSSGSCTFINNKCSGNNQGIYIQIAKDNTVSNNCIISNSYGIYLFSTTGNSITGNTCSKNTSGAGYALYLADNANNNTVNGNISESNTVGIRVKNAHSNKIFNNISSNNSYGLEIATGSIGNVFYLNNFIDNTSGQISSGYGAVAGNSWNSPTQMSYSFNGSQYNSLVGNYWSGYSGADADGNGIGDTPYQTVLTDNDNYPLMGQWKDGVITGSAVATHTVTFEITPEDATIVVKDSENVEVSAEADGTYKLEAGDYSYTVSADSYVTKTGTITVAEADQTVTVVLEAEAVVPTTYTVTFNLTPQNAAVVVKDSEGAEVAAEADGTYKLEAGEYSYTVSAEGYVTKAGTFTVVDEAQTVTVALEKETVQPDKPRYSVTPAQDAIYTIGETADGIKTITVNAGQSGFKYFEASITPVKANEGTETVVFTHVRNGVQLGINALVADFDVVNKAKAGFNVNPGDVVKVYIVDQLTNNKDHNPIVFQ